MRATAWARAGRLALAAAWLAALAPGPALASAKPPAAIPAPYQPPAWPEAPSSGGLLARLAVMTVGSVGCAGAALWWARRMQRGGGGTNAGPGAGQGPRIVASLPLAGRCALHLLEVDNAGFVVATDASGLKVIQALPESFDALVDEEIAGDLVAPPVPPPAPELDLGPEELALIPRQVPMG